MPRESKYSTEELKEIIRQFINQGKHKIGKLNYTNLADFASKEMGLKSISYYHFSRNEEIKKIIKEYSKTLKESSLGISNDNNSFTSLNVREFVKMNSNKPVQLTFLLTNLQEAQINLYNRTVESELKAKDLQNQLNSALEANKKYKRKYKELKTQYEELLEHSLVLAEALNREEEKQFLGALKSTGVVLVNSEMELPNEDISDLEEQKDLEKFLAEYSNILD